MNTAHTHMHSCSDSSCEASECQKNHHKLDTSDWSASTLHTLCLLQSVVRLRHISRNDCFTAAVLYFNWAINVNQHEHHDSSNSLTCIFTFHVSVTCDICLTKTGTPSCGQCVQLQCKKLQLRLGLWPSCIQNNCVLYVWHIHILNLDTGAAAQRTYIK